MESRVERPLYNMLAWILVAVMILKNGSSIALTNSKLSHNRKCRYRSTTVICLNRRSRFSLSMLSKKAERIILSNSHIIQLNPVAMRRFRNLRYLQVDNNKISSLKGSLTRNPKLEFIDASNNRLGNNVMGYDGALKKAFHNNKRLQSVNISHNQIKKLSSTMMGRKRNNLKHLDVSHNHLRMLGKSLWFLEQLEKLDLSHNHITSISQNAFNRNRKLRQLNLSGNQLSFTRSPLDFTRNEELQQLLVLDNRLESFRELDLSRSYKLKEINLAMNKLRRIDKNDLKNNLNLIYLNVSKNHIRMIHSQSLQYLRNLHTLDLSGNMLTHLHRNIFQKLRNLTVLSLGYNALSTLHKNIFAGNRALVSLDLAGNSLQQSQLETLRENVNLQLLDLRYNAFGIGKDDLFPLKIFTPGTRNARTVMQELACLKISAETSTHQTQLWKSRLRDDTWRKSCEVRLELKHVTWTCGCHQ